MREREEHGDKKHSATFSAFLIGFRVFGRVGSLLDLRVSLKNLFGLTLTLSLVLISTPTFTATLSPIPTCIRPLTLTPTLTLRGGVAAFNECNSIDATLLGNNFESQYLNTS